MDEITLNPNFPLKNLRESLGLTQEKAAEICGVAQNTLCAAECRGVGIKIATLRKVLDASGYDLRIVAVRRIEKRALANGGQLLKVAREHAGLSCEDLAGMVGCTAGHVRAVESGSVALSKRGILGRWLYNESNWKEK